ncbi:MAG TPA: hypothetical protein VKW06_19520 [Candidatus Angelobacter sp.]|nr:hypothetical protein [Candidatus Angelobacter sp.]
MNDHEQLLEQFIASFEKLDDMSAIQGLSPVDWQLSTTKPDEYGRITWRPRKVGSPRAQLDRLYLRFPLRFPTLFETLLLSYRWEEVDLGYYRLLANPPGADLSGFYGAISRDSAVWDVLVPSGHLPFAKGPKGDFDPVCFATKSRDKVGDCRIVKINHKEIMFNRRVKIVSQMALSFKDLVTQTVAKANEIAGPA